MYILSNFLQNINFWANVSQKKLFYYYIENVFQIEEK
jgi:vesicle coat complex subunit